MGEKCRRYNALSMKSWKAMRLHEETTTCNSQKIKISKSEHESKTEVSLEKFSLKICLYYNTFDDASFPHFFIVIVFINTIVSELDGNTEMALMTILIFDVLKLQLNAIVRTISIDFCQEMVVTKLSSFILMLCWQYRNIFQCLFMKWTTSWEHTMVRTHLSTQLIMRLSENTLVLTVNHFSLLCRRDKAVFSAVSISSIVFEDILHYNAQTQKNEKHRQHGYNMEYSSIHRPYLNFSFHLIVMMMMMMIVMVVVQSVRIQNSNFNNEQWIKYEKCSV